MCNTVEFHQNTILECAVCSNPALSITKNKEDII